MKNNSMNSLNSNLPIHQETLLFLDSQSSSVTGLIESFPNTSKYLYYPPDASFSLQEKGYLEKQCFTYDQALSAIAYTLLGKFDKAKNILNLLDFNFHISKGDKIGLFNSYKTDALSEDGKTLIMGIDGDRIHAGPNLWVGLACYQYMSLSGDNSFFPLCLEIVKWAIHKLQHFPLRDGQRGGISMGFGWGANWQEVYSTENNIDYFALLRNLEYCYSAHDFARGFFEKQGIHLHEIQRERDGIRRWLKEIVYNADAGHFYAGFNEKGVDSTKALDTVTFTILSIGMQELIELGIDPERLIVYAEEFLEVQTIIKERKCYGFDFAYHRMASLKRPPIIWVEGTYQMILTYKIAADYFFSKGELKKTEYYQDKAKKYLNYMDVLIDYSDIKFRMPAYSSAKPKDEEILMTFNDEWEIPRGNQGQYIPAVVSSVWRLMSLMNFNPMSESPIINEKV